MSAADLVVVVLAVGFGAAIKSVTGLGLPVVAIPIMGLAVGVETAVVVMAVPSLVSNLWLFREHRSGSGEFAGLMRVLVPGLGGAVLGTVMLKGLDGRWIALVLAVAVAAYAVTFLARPEQRISVATQHRVGPFVGLGGGVLQGAVGASGPLVGTFLHGCRLSRSGYIFTTTRLFHAFGTVQFVMLLVLGLYDRARVVGTLAALAAVAVVFPVGLRFGRRVDGSPFERLVLGVLVVATGVLLLQQW